MKRSSLISKTDVRLPQELRTQHSLPRANLAKNYHDELKVFLVSCNLKQYYKPLVENGFEDLRALMDIDEKHLEIFQMPMGHKLKFIKGC
jgi:hypothetical protein